MKRKLINWFPKKYIFIEFCNAIKNHKIINVTDGKELNEKLYDLICSLEKTWKRSPFKKLSKFKLKHGFYTIQATYSQEEFFICKLHIRYTNRKNNKLTSFIIKTKENETLG